MSHQDGFITLGGAVDEYIAERKLGEQHYATYLALARNVLREMNLHGGSRCIRTQTLKRNSATASVGLPIDCTKVLNAAICFGNGRYILLGYDPTMCSPENEQARDFCPPEQPDETARFENDCNCATDGAYPGYYQNNTGALFDQFEAGNYVGRQFAVGAGYRHGGVWSVNYNARTIWIRETCQATDVIIRYISTGISYDSRTYVDEAAIMALKAGIAYQEQLNANGSGRRVGVDVKFAEFKRQNTLLFGLRRGTSVQRILASARRNTALGKISR